jgi:hypothetical protein
MRHDGLIYTLHRLTDNVMTVDEVKQAPLASFGVTGTPTLMLVDSGGVLKQKLEGEVAA